MRDLTILLNKLILCLPDHQRQKKKMNVKISAKRKYRFESVEDFTFAFFLSSILKIDKRFKAQVPHYTCMYLLLKILTCDFHDHLWHANIYISNFAFLRSIRYLMKHLMCITFQAKAYRHL